MTPLPFCFNWNETILFSGTTYSAAHLPRLYTLAWLVIGSPPALVLCTLLGLVAAAVFLLKKKRVVDPKIVVISLAFLMSLAAIIGLHAVVLCS